LGIEPMTSGSVARELFIIEPTYQYIIMHVKDFRVINKNSFIHA
jgi:hypothetical protein